MGKLRSVPAFRTEAEERKFWETHNSTDYIDWSKAEHARFPNLKPSKPFPAPTNFSTGSAT
jgi:hypothetical protein